MGLRKIKHWITVVKKKKRIDHSRQSQYIRTLQYSSFSLFKRLSHKLWFLFDRYSVSRNEHCQDRYSLSLEKPVRRIKTSYLKKIDQSKHSLLTSVRDKHDGLLKWLEYRPIDSACRLLTSTERQKRIFWPIF